MDKQVSIFFVQLTHQHGGALLINITDIMYALPDTEGGSIIAIRDDTDNSLLCKETPEQVGTLVRKAMADTVAQLTRTAYNLARELS